jgi:hypothetical protein
LAPGGKDIFDVCGANGVEMNKAPAFQFYIKDWLSDPQLKMASHSTKGVWMDMLCLMWAAPERGELTGTAIQLKKAIGCTDYDWDTFSSEANALLFCDISVTDNGTITVRNRRMWREEKDRENNRVRQHRHRESRKSNEDVTPLSPSASPSPSPKNKEIKAKESPVDNSETEDVPFSIGNRQQGSLKEKKNGNGDLKTETQKLTEQIFKIRHDKEMQVDVFKFVREVINDDNRHKESIPFCLKRLLEYIQSQKPIESPYALLKHIYKAANGNFNERDYVKDMKTKGMATSADLMKAIGMKSGGMPG